MSDFLAGPRIKDPALLRVLKLEYDECEITGVTYSLHLHHVIYKSKGGDDLRENIICLSQSFHNGYHAHDPFARWQLASHVDTSRPDVAGYIMEKLGSPQALLEWFHRHGLPNERRMP